AHSTVELSFLNPASGSNRLPRRRMGKSPRARASASTTPAQSGPPSPTALSGVPTGRIPPRAARHPAAECSSVQQIEAAVSGRNGEGGRQAGGEGAAQANRLFGCKFPCEKGLPSLDAVVLLKPLSQ